jgi:hypothetical protein
MTLFVGGQAKPIGTKERISLVLRGLWGTLLLVGPTHLLRALRTDVNDRSVSMARALGLRHLLQLIALLAGGARIRRIGVAIDALHATSALVVGGLDSRWRKAAFLDAMVAISFSVSGVGTSNQQHEGIALRSRTTKGERREG